MSQSLSIKVSFQRFLAESEFGVSTVTIAADFSAGESAYPVIRDGVKDLDVGILVNNVGVNTSPMYFTEVIYF